jgi:two-component system, OmpR family, response regulator
VSAAAGTVPRVLLAEDDDAIRTALVAALEASAYKVRALADGDALVEEAAAFRPDLAVLDIGFPAGPDGFELARRLRTATDAPVVFLTAADGVEDRLRGFEVGADDYVVKPFVMAELLARIRVVLRRSGRLASSTHEVRDLVVDEVSRVVLRSGTPVELTKTEFDLLCVLVREPGRVLSKQQLLSMVWGFDDFDPNLVEVYVSSLRRKLEAVGDRVLHTERGAGYVVRP